jgi:hypothetical protein
MEIFVVTVLNNHFIDGRLLLRLLEFVCDIFQGPKIYGIANGKKSFWDENFYAFFVFHNIQTNP